MTSYVITLEDKQIWSERLAQLPLDQQDVYYSPEYYELYQNNDEGTAMCFIFESNGDIALYPFLMNSVNNCGYNLNNTYFDIQGAYGYNGVVSSCHTDSFRKQFHSDFSNLCQEQNIIAEFTRYHPLLNNQQFSTGYLNIDSNRSTVFINLENRRNCVSKETSSPAIRNIKKAKGSGLSSTINDDGDVDKFISLYHQTMDKVNSSKYLYFNREYFENLFKLPSLLTIDVNYRGNTIASAACFAYKDYFHYHLGGSDQNYLPLRSNDYLFYGIINAGIKTECRYLHLGGGHTRSGIDGLLRFKRKFSSDLGSFYTGSRIHNEDVYRSVCEMWEKSNSKKPRKFDNYCLFYRGRS